LKIERRKFGGLCNHQGRDLRRSRVKATKSRAGRLHRWNFNYAVQLGVAQLAAGEMFSMVEEKEGDESSGDEE